MVKITLDNISITPMFNSSIYNESLYIDNIKALVNKALPEDFNLNSDEEYFDFKKNNVLNEILPIVNWSNINISNSKFSVILLCKQKKNINNFFYDLISRWLIPETQLSVDVFFMADFLFKPLNEVFTVAEMVVDIPSHKHCIEILKNKRIIETEIRLGVTSHFHANRIMQFKGLSYDKKTVMIQEKIAALMQSRSKDFGQSIFSHMQQFLVTCSENFKTQRDYHHISRIISVLFIMKKILTSKINDLPNKRHINLKFLKTKIYHEKGEKEVLGIIVGINFIKEHEVFNKIHLLKAVNALVYDSIEVKSSFFIDKTLDSNIQTIYLEVEKKSGKNFTFDEIRTLKNKLPFEVKSHIETLIHRIFMPRNEEEVVKNILTLSRQLQFVNDIPQVIINFDDQNISDLSFTVILLRVLKSKSQSIHEMFKNVPVSIKFIPERVKKVGILRRKYLKEANVFRVVISSKNYVRKDRSVDLNLARIDIVENLNQVFGEVRDYNGGMIYKQNEALNSLKLSLSQSTETNEVLLEKYFYAIRPVEMGVITPIFSLKNMFLMLSNAIKRKESEMTSPNNYLFKKEQQCVYSIIPVYESQKKKQIKEAISKYYLLSRDFITFDLQYNDIHYLGYIFNCEDDIRQKNFLKVIQQALDFEMKRG